ncbi:MAG: hypothetical protein BroJett029_26900 [Alphaproteobacteria bacterium]|nr:MAG: hypothetical protein BroJett029_26900 [Alphaproteobacteria bacterium]
MTGRVSRIPAAAVLDPRLSGDAIRVLSVLGMYADPNGRCVPNLADMSALIGLSRPWVQRQLRLLEGAGYVVSERHGPSGGPIWPPAYRLHFGAPMHRIALPDRPTPAQQATASSPDLDLIWRFLSDCSETGGRARASDLYRAYAIWARRNGHEPRSATFFGRRLNDLQVSKVKDGFIFYVGLQLTDDVAGWLDRLDGVGELEGSTASKGHHDAEEIGQASAEGTEIAITGSETLQPSQTLPGENACFATGCGGLEGLDGFPR